MNTSSVADRSVDCTSPKEECRKAEPHDHIVQFSEELPTALRRAFQWRDLDGLAKSKEVRILGAVDGALKAQLARARAKLTRFVRRALDARLRYLRRREGAKWSTARPRACGLLGEFPCGSFGLR